VCCAGKKEGPVVVLRVVQVDAALSWCESGALVLTPPPAAAAAPRTHSCRVPGMPTADWGANLKPLRVSFLRDAPDDTTLHQ
jgi:hypothetical protein